MKGHLHHRLHRRLRAAVETGGHTQKSLGDVMQKTGSNVGQYLRAQAAGTLDLDEAAAALSHIGSSLEDFLADEPGDSGFRANRLARLLAARPELCAIVEELSQSPKSRATAVLAYVHSMPSGVRSDTQRAPLRPALSVVGGTTRARR